MIQPKVQFQNFDVLRVCMKWNEYVRKGKGMYEMEWVCKKGKGYVRNGKGM